jgi:hypothetical protein
MPRFHLHLIVLTLLVASPVMAQSTASGFRLYDPYFVGWSSEPTMLYGGLTVASFQRGTARLFGSTDIAKSKPGLAAIWEVPAALFLSTATHEINGHGGRAREFDLSPSYGFGFDFSAYTSIRRDPKNVNEVLYLAAAGTEADSILANQLLADLYRPHGAEGSTVPLALIAKLDFTLYVNQTTEPNEDNADDFFTQFEEGNDIAIYLGSRQGLRRGLDPRDVWNRNITIDYHERLLAKNYSAVRDAAYWNLLDPLTIAATVSYIRDHLANGNTRITPPMLQLGDKVGLSAGTRAFLAPAYVTRYLDVYARIPVGLATVYIRDLDSSIERRYGYGAGFTLAQPDSRFSASLHAESWQEPDSAEHGAGDDCWNVNAEVRVPTGPRFGLAAYAGHKTAGFLPGLPSEEGTYAGFGMTFVIGKL